MCVLTETALVCGLAHLTHTTKKVLGGSVVAQGHAADRDRARHCHLSIPLHTRWLFTSPGGVICFHTCLLGLGLSHSRSPKITILSNRIVWLAFLQWVNLAQCKQFFQADNETS